MSSFYIAENARTTKGEVVNWIVSIAIAGHHEYSIYLDKNEMIELRNMITRTIEN